MKKKSLLASSIAALWCLPALGAPTFVNGIAIPGSSTDLSGDPGLSGRLGFFSDLYFDSNMNEWYGLADRGPGGGTLPYATRVERFTIDVNSTTGSISNFKVVQTIKFTDPNNVLGAGAGGLNGLAPAPTNILGRAFDPEGFVVNPRTGKFLVSDEYGPSLYEFNRDGTLARAFTTPANLIPRDKVSGLPNYAGDPATNPAGKRTNRGFEGLAISPDGKFAYAMLQSAMLDEGGGSGVHDRIVKFDTETGQAVAQYVYKLEGSSQGRGISALVAVNDHEFLVLERNNRGTGVDSELETPNKKVFRIDLAGATDVTNVVLPATGALPAGVIAVTKIATPFADLSTTSVAQLGNRAPEKLEGLTIGPMLADGTYALIFGTDNDFSVTQDAGTGVQFDEYYNPISDLRIRCTIGTFDNCTSVLATGALGTPFAGATDGFALIPGVLFAFKTAAGDLLTYVEPIPTPATLPLFLLGLAGLGLRHRVART